jgi:hypothetical protein
VERDVRVPSPVSDVERTFTAALDRLIEDVKRDRTIQAAILGGSLSHDKVWAKSDIDLVLVTTDERKDPRANDTGRGLYADGVNIHAILVSRAEFRAIVEGAVHNSFMHSFLAKSRLLYTHDPSIETLLARLSDIGERDTQFQLLRAATGALPAIYKAHKFFITRGDLEYTALWILAAAHSLARIEVFSRRLLADREVLLQALQLDPAFFRIVYTDLLNTPKTRAQVQAALDAVDAYLADRARTLFGPVLEYLAEAGDARAASEIEAHFKRHFDIEGVTTACEYLADQGLIGKASAPVKLTKKSSIEVQELAFFSTSSTSPPVPPGR